MSDRLTYGHPVREAYVHQNGKVRTVWLEHIWNTGIRTRTVVDIELAKSDINLCERDLPDLSDQ